MAQVHLRAVWQSTDRQAALTALCRRLQPTGCDAQTPEPPPRSHLKVRPAHPYSLRGLRSSEYALCQDRHRPPRSRMYRGSSHLHGSRRGRKVTQSPLSRDRGPYRSIQVSGLRRQLHRPTAVRQPEPPMRDALIGLESCAVLLRHLQGCPFVDRRQPARHLTPPVQLVGRLIARVEQPLSLQLVRNLVVARETLRLANFLIPRKPKPLQTPPGLPARTLPLSARYSCRRNAG